MHTPKGSEGWASIQKDKGDLTWEAKPTYFIESSNLEEKRWTNDIFTCSALQDKKCLHLWSYILDWKE